MKFDEFKEDAVQNLADRKDLTEQQLDEILPVVLGIARGAAGVGRAIGAVGRVAGGAARAVGGAAKAVGGAAKSVGGAARSAGAVAQKGVQGTARGMGKVRRGAENVGNFVYQNTPDRLKKKATDYAVSAAEKKLGQAKTQMLKKAIKPGSQIELPTDQKNQQKKARFKVGSVKGNKVTVQNPQRKPGEPEAFTFDISDLEDHV